MCAQDTWKTLDADMPVPCKLNVLPLYLMYIVCADAMLNAGPPRHKEETIHTDRSVARRSFQSHLVEQPVLDSIPLDVYEFFTTPTLAARSTRPLSKNPFCCV